MQPQNPAVAPWYFDWIRHSTRDDFWRQCSIRDRYPSVKVPVLDFEGWYDAFLAGGIENFAGMVAHGGTAAGPRQPASGHRPVGSRQLGQTRLDPAPMLKAHRRGRRQPDQRPDAGVVRPLPEGHRTTTSPGNPGSTTSSWVPTPGSPRRVGLCRRQSGRRTTCPGPGGVDDRKGAARIRRARRPAAGHSTSTTPHSRRPAWAVTPAAVRSPARRDRTTRLPSSSDPTSWSTAARHLTTDTEVTGPVTVRLWAQSSSAPIPISPPS